MINIYKITCETGKTYYGSTKQTLKKRLSGHKCKNNYCSSKDFINPKMELLETCEKEQQKQRESYYIRNFECVNKKIDDRKRKEWYEKNKEKEKERNKIWYKNNKEIQNENTKKWYKDNKKIHNENQKKWYEKNKEKERERKKKYYQNNKEKTTCECGAIVTKKSLPRHKKSNKHKINISVLNKNVSI